MDLQNSNNKLLNWLMNNRDVSKETVVLHQCWAIKDNLVLKTELMMWIGHH